MTDRRPSPDALLGLAQRERRGRLKIFLGAAPGVGKTYAMLQGARRVKEEGRDVVIGIAETHGRPETAALLDGLEVLPRREWLYRGHQLRDFDIDAALARRPELIVIDELPHSNPPEARHPKRYQDVEELIAAGIDVWSALNIQHIESLADVVSAITGVKVRELVPDIVVERADDVVLVDITPDELIQRLKAGKVYLGDNARRAGDNFLQPGNLTALRELALRRTAQRVDDQMIDYLRQKAIEGPWPTAERILVCVGADVLAEQVVRAAARLANGLNATWIAVHVNRPTQQPGPEELKAVDAALALAERLGAEVKRQSSSDIAEDVLHLARRQNITQIIVGRSKAGALMRLLGRSFPDQLLRQANGIAIHVLAGADGGSAHRWKWPTVQRSGVLAAALAVAVATVASLSLTQVLRLPNLSMIFLAAVLFCAVTQGRRSAVAAAFFSFLAYNFFFIEPRFTLTVASAQELLSLFIFLLVAVLTGGLAGRVREQTVAALASVKRTQSLLDLSSKLSGALLQDDVLWVLVTHAAAAVGGQSIVLLRHGDDLPIVASMPPEDSLGTADHAAARWAAERGEEAGWRTGTLPSAGFLFLPLRTPQGVIGALGVKPNAENLSNENRRMIEAIVNQASLALERTRLAGEAADARATAEGEKLRSALLSSVSHDLRTPLSSIVGSVTALRTLGGRMQPAERDDLLLNIEEEATRLSRFVTNLLDMTKLESGGVNIRRSNSDIRELAAAAVGRARAMMAGQEIALELPEVPVLAAVDPALIEQMVFNLLDNAHKYGGGAPIRVRVDGRDGRTVLIVEDQGPGIAKGDLEKVFEKFYRVRDGDGRPAGTGLGLAICRAIAEAMGGTIRAESPAAMGQGARFVVELPGVVSGDAP
ncbi:ATP-binding protein [Aestuariivirga sp.]|uniref:ATP-binding protein n=1 Tax=Aestuariivirga sp. TaxID=2650926 RepID=UPI003BAADA9E